MLLEALRLGGGHTPPSQGKRAFACTTLGAAAVHHVRRAFPFAGGPGLACRSCARVSFLAAGRRRRTWSLRTRALILISASFFAVPVPSGNCPDCASS